MRVSRHAHHEHIDVLYYIDIVDEHDVQHHNINYVAGPAILDTQYDGPHVDASADWSFR